jgi:transposase
MEGLPMKAYSKDLRQRVLADCDGKMEIRQVAVKYRVSESWIRRLRQRRRESGEVAPRKRASPAPKWLAYSESIEQVIAERPDVTLAELQAELGLPFSLQTLCRALQALRFTFKKKSSARPNKTGRTSRKGVRSGGRGKAD